MARFVKVTDDYIKSFSEEQENENTRKKTQYDLRIFNEFLSSVEESREIHTIPPNELQDLAIKFVLGVRKKNGEEYEPSSLRAFLQSVDRYLRKKSYSLSLLNDREFSGVQEILKKKQKQLKSIGKGNKPNSADPLTDEEIEEFYRKGVLGNSTPRALLNTVWMNNCVYFGMRPGKEQRDLCWGDLELKTNTEGVRYVEFSTERQTKTRTGENPRNVRENKPKMYENLDNPDRCPVSTYLAYKERRPAEMMDDGSPFYLAVNTEIPRPGKSWFKASPLGVNSLRAMVKSMLESSQIQSDKKLVNHSTRKHLVQKLVDNNVPANEIVQITGHKNINSLNNYSAISDKKQQHISAILSGSNEAPSSQLAIQPSQRITVDEIAAVSAVQPSTSASSQPVFHQCQIGTVNIFTNVDQQSREFRQSFKRRRVVISDSDESQ